LKTKEMQLFIQFDESETKHLITLEKGQSFGSNSDNLDFMAISEGEEIRIRLNSSIEYPRHGGIHLGCKIAKDSIKAHENILLFNNFKNDA